MFAALLDERQGGRFQVAPLSDQARQKQLYLPDTCVLLSDAGVAEVSDFMPIAETQDQHDIVRRVKTVRGEVRFRMICQPQFDYARAAHAVERTQDGALFVSTGRYPLALRLRATVPVRVEDGAVVAEFKRPRASPSARPDSDADALAECPYSSYPILPTPLRVQGFTPRARWTFQSSR